MTEVVLTPTLVQKPPHAMELELVDGVQALLYFSLALNAQRALLFLIIACSHLTNN